MAVAEDTKRVARRNGIGFKRVPSRHFENRSPGPAITQKRWRRKVLSRKKQDEKEKDGDTRADKCTAPAKERRTMCGREIVRVDFSMFRTSVFCTKRVSDEGAANSCGLKSHVHRSI